MKLVYEGHFLDKISRNLLKTGFVLWSIRNFKRSLGHTEAGEGRVHTTPHSDIHSRTLLLKLLLSTRIYT
jgi:hypothetical protein